MLWIGLKNSDDQGTQFDLRAEVFIEDAYGFRLVAVGETRCITGVTRNPNKAKEVTVTFDPIAISRWSFSLGRYAVFGNPHPHRNQSESRD